MQGKLKSKLKLTEYIILMIYTPLYVAFVLTALIQGEFNPMTTEIAGFLVLFILFLIIVFISFTKELLAGILFLVWVAGVIFVDLTLVEEDSGMGIISSIPILAVGLLIIKRVQETKAREKFRAQFK